MENIVIIGIFIAVLLVLESSYFAYRSIRKPELKRIRKRLRALSFREYGSQVDIIKKRLLSEIPWLNRLLLKIPLTQKIELLLEQADVKYHTGFFILLSLLLASVGFLIFSQVTSDHPVAITAAILVGILPFFYLRVKKEKRMQRFVRQLPDALDLIARSLKAGHAFTEGLRMVSEECADPIGTEFGKTLAEINFGINVPEALKNLSDRVDCPDLKFFVISVILQRETGGNLAEILENIGLIMRERFKLNGRIRILSAEAKLSALVLSGLPFVLAFTLYLINPEYIKLLLTDSIGKKLLVLALLLMMIGIYMMKKMISIKV